MAKYTPISLNDIKNVLTADCGWYVARSTGTLSNEYLMERPLCGTIVLRVWTSIHVNDSLSKGKGKDAIRVCAVNIANDKGYIKATRVHRVAGWKANLLSRVATVTAEAEERWAKDEAKAHAKIEAEAKAAEAAAKAEASKPAPAIFATKKSRLEHYRQQLGTQAKWAYRALEIIYDYQTEAEKDAQSVEEDNGVGFSGIDGEILSSFAEQFAKKRKAYGPTARLSPKQEALLLKKMPKYAKQLIAHLEAKGTIPCVGKAVA